MIKRRGRKFGIEGKNQLLFLYKNNIYTLITTKNDCYSEADCFADKLSYNNNSNDNNNSSAQ